MSEKIPLSRPWIDGDELSEVESALRSGWISRGPISQKFEAAVAEYVGVNPRNVISVNSCTAALHIALVARGIGPGDEVIVPDYTFPATAFAVAYTGARPVIVDIDPDTFCMDPEAAKDAITDRTKAIIPVSLFGHPADMEAFEWIGVEADVTIIEDAACALGARIGSRNCGSFGDFAAFSFHPRKVITTGEGGILIAHDDAEADLARNLSQFGIMGAYERANCALRGERLDVVPEFKCIGYNYKMSDIAAAVGIAQMRKLEQSIEYRAGIADLWRRALGHAAFKHPNPAPGIRHSWQAYVVTLPDPELRWGLIKAMHSIGMEAGIGTYSLQKQPVFKQIARIEDCPISADIESRTVALPIFPGLEFNHDLFIPKGGDNAGAQG